MMKKMLVLLLVLSVASAAFVEVSVKVRDDGTAVISGYRRIGSVAAEDEPAAGGSGEYEIRALDGSGERLMERRFEAGFPPSGEVLLTFILPEESCRVQVLREEKLLSEGEVGCGSEKGINLEMGKPDNFRYFAAGGFLVALAAVFFIIPRK